MKMGNMGQHLRISKFIVVFGFGTLVGHFISVAVCQHIALAALSAARETKESSVSMEVHRSGIPPANSKATDSAKVRSRTKPIEKPTTTRPPFRIEESDKIYKNEHGQSPVVLASHKLVFFNIPRVEQTTFLKLFRRMMGFDDWNTLNPYQEDGAGLQFLYTHSLDKASKIMADPAFTKAVFVRDPKERFVSAFKGEIQNHDESVKQTCCAKGEDCLKDAQNIGGFVELAQKCLDRHWAPVSSLIDERIIPKIDFVGNYGNIKRDTMRMLEMVDAWDDFGASGWGESGKEAIFDTREDNIGTNLTQKLLTEEMKSTLDTYYAGDYSTEKFSLNPNMDTK